jgi:ABC-2 type transport system ATP-binding protein
VATALFVDNLSKRFGAVLAVDSVTFAVQPGRVTGFLGPNGAGKTTTLRCLLGLVAPTSGSARIGEVAYRQLPRPIQTVGAALEASGFHPGRTGRNHLRVQTAAAGLPDSRADECLDLVGLGEAARRRVGGYSLGMRQRLALAGALLGDPEVLILDEPANGLDPAGMAWLRGLLRWQAQQGRTVLLSSHVLAEVEQTVDDIVILHRGRLVHTGALGDLTAAPAVLVLTPQAAILADTLRAGGATVSEQADGSLRVDGVESAAVGAAALVAGVELHELRTERRELEDVFFSLTEDAQP